QAPEMSGGFSFVEGKMATTIATGSLLRGLRCRACGALQPADERYVCGDCLGPIEPDYQLDALRGAELRERIERGPRSLWRYAAFLPVSEPSGHFPVGWT